MKTPAQLYGHPTLDDVPVAGPTDPGILKADCWYRNNVLPATPACVDCGGGAIPHWAQSKGLLGDKIMLDTQISFGGKRAHGFSLAAPGDPDIWASLTPAQQMWVSNTLNTLNSKIMSATGTSCASWGPAINLAGRCFQIWYNANYGASGASKSLRTDGAFDQDTLSALIMVAGIHASDASPLAPPYPGGTATAAPATKLSKGEMVGIGLAVATVAGGGIYLATKKKSSRRRRK